MTTESPAPAAAGGDPWDPEQAAAELAATLAALEPGSPEHVVRRYLGELYNQRRLDLIPELIADPEIRHAPGERKVTTLAENTERLEKMFAACPVLRFDPVVVITQGDLVSVAWNGWSTQTDGRSYAFAAVELFRVRDGQIVEIWNAKEAKGLWSAD